MNSVVLIGRLTGDPEMRYIASSQTAVAQFSVAVDRPFSKDKEKITDFFRIVVFGKPAENCEKFLAKGRLVGVQGRLQNNNYTTQSGEKRYTTEVVAERVEFLEWGDKKPSGGSGGGDFERHSEPSSRLPEGFQALEDDDDDDIPF